MPALLLAGPMAEPLGLAEAKTYLRVDHDAEDALIASLITAARATVEALTRRVLIDQRWRLVRDTWPVSGLIAVPVNPLREIVAAHVVEEAGTEVEVPLSAFTANMARLPGLIRVDRSAVPAPGRSVAGIAIDVIAGHGPDADHVPSPLIEAVRLVLAHFYEHRDVPGPGAAFPASLDALVAPFRVTRL
ncbi:head-tail connector protein [Ancylobacter amanitiformis]|uniref:PhiE125 gp8 family phage protein n=1 Tax=Ancylobacter amanitiformis TaxID=217069 RepID=A0ABU0LM48_9HYPH|nr:head-tail connector protein [Ancylobacter amanitiformis]MDQ0509744.1 putative phiE125 gp8 family phage protein [Ancylobacter amanitiformis]